MLRVVYENGGLAMVAAMGVVDRNEGFAMVVL